MTFILGWFSPLGVRSGRTAASVLLPFMVGLHGRALRASQSSMTLVLVVAMAACAPSATDLPRPIATTVEMRQPPALAAASPTATLEAATPPEASATPAAQPEATSRGQDLEATDPRTVSLASGGLHLVEFFRFT